MCILTPATYYSLREKYGDNACEHCVYHQYGCPKRNSVTVNGHLYLPIEESLTILPKCKIWCKKCKARNGTVQHETIWNARRAYIIKCDVCGSEFLLYREKVQAEYTGFMNMKGEYISPHEYSKRITQFCNEMSQRNQIPETEHFASFGEKSSSSTMLDALKKAGFIQ